MSFCFTKTNVLNLTIANIFNVKASIKFSRCDCLKRCILSFFGISYFRELHMKMWFISCKWFQYSYWKQNTVEENKMKFLKICITVKRLLKILSFNFVDIFKFSWTKICVFGSPQTNLLSHRRNSLFLCNFQF